MLVARPAFRPALVRGLALQALRAGPRAAGAVEAWWPVTRVAVLAKPFGHHRWSSTKTTVGEAVLCNKSDTVVLSVPHSDEMRFPFVWLRDNCQCSVCFHTDSRSRTIDVQTFDINSKPTEVKVSRDTVHIIWLDGHVSDFNINWLKEHSFQKEAQQMWLKSMYRLPRKTWTAQSFEDILTRFQFSDVLKSDESLYNWLVNLATFGVSIIENAPAESSTIRNLAERVAFIRRTHYGEEFSVRAKPGTTNVAYLSANLQLHTDLPYYNYKPGANLLHCLVQTESDGGSNLLTDTLAVAEWIKRVDANSYQVLTQTIVDWNDIGQEDGNHFHSIHRAPVISENRFGEIERINFSQPQRDSHFNIPVEDVKPWYQAMDKFIKAVYSNDFCVTYKMKEGEVLTFDNIRLLHGRRKYEDTGNVVRHVIGGYLDWDEIWSRIRVLKKEIHPSD
ncbi:gamma-butyrobetaine dioxygenase [Frankliniella occidentalis]|uniref:Gamma-butyrobetaine dioxygenase n=1 Tax=Frankliniella occidentalis TaxID=133901 RepID=A0A6J1SQ13_FRAOC|nr:gamma-butyrobetaine dioxygenase [Frankliniella occidentalis]XP_026283002.1 gamma-butyrobetaine dioxygenase [Frankliniella occidentalis]XP_052128937.1 gamma-butyrobetaine dioxygenase [Frankliniella occidentalis]